MHKPVLAGMVLVLLSTAACADVGDSADPGGLRQGLAGGAHRLPNDVPVPNPSGAGATYSTAGSIDLDNPFFAVFGTNGRTCGTCHRPEDGWTLTPATARRLFESSRGLDPLFHQNDGTNSPLADRSTVEARRLASSMLLDKGLIRIGMAIPDGADFELADVDDPYGYASAAQLSLFRRPLASMNLFFLSTVMWDGRETLVDNGTPLQPDSNCLAPPFPAKCFLAVDPYDLAHQALDATLGHAQATVPGLTDDQQASIVEFESQLMFAQVRDDRAGLLDAAGARGGPDAIPDLPGYFGLNDNFGDYQTGQPFTSAVFDLYDAWADAGADRPAHHGLDARDRKDQARRAVARGQAIFNRRAFTISGVGGLNGAAGLPEALSGTCSTCHNSPDAGDHTIPLPLDIGVAAGALRTPDLPLYTLRCSVAGVAAGHCAGGETVEVTDPGRAMVSGAWADIGKFKGPTLRGLAARAPYFHNGSAADIAAVVNFYDARFNIGFTAQERSDLIAFLRTL